MAQKALTSLALVLDNHCTAAGIARRALATRTGIPHTTLVRRFTVGGFTVPELAAIADVLNIPASALLLEAEQVAA